MEFPLLLGFRLVPVLAGFLMGLAAGFAVVGVFSVTVDVLFLGMG
jgi:hypothetical protein